MNPFSLVCKSCASRLKVTKLSAIGQTLACPKCGTMVQVQPPSDWVPPPGYESSVGGSASLGSFEDIESILKQTGAPAVGPPDSPNKPSRKRSTSSKQSTKANSLQVNPPATGKPSKSVRTQAVAERKQPIANPAAVESASVDKPVLPGNDWTSEATKKRKRLILMVSSAIGTVIAVAAIIVAIVVNSNDRVAEVESKKSDAEQKSDLPEDRPLPDGEVDPNANAENKDDQKDIDADDGGLDETPTGGTVTPAPITQEGAIGKAPAVPSISEGPFSAPSTNASSGDANVDPSKATPGTMPLLPGSDQSFAGNQAIDPSPDVDPEKIKVVDQDDGLGELGTLLEFADSSLQELESVAANFESQPKSILTKYYVEQENPEKVDVPRTLELPIPGLASAKPIPFSQAVELMSAISGLPITIDARQIVLMGKPVDPMVTPQLEDVTVLDALTALGKVQGDHIVTPIATETGVVMTIPALDELVEAVIDFPKVAGLELSERERFVASIETIISPDEWTRKEDPGSIELVDDKIHIRSTLITQKLIRLFVDKLDACVVLMEDAGNAEANQMVASRWASTQAKMMADPKLKPGATLGIGEFFARVKKQTGLSVLIDWESVVGAGWWPTTRFPGEIVEPTNEAMLEQLTLAMGLTPIAVDQETVVITTPERSRAFLDLEVYPISERVSNEVTDDNLRELVFRLLGNQVNGQFVRVTYEPRCRCLIVVAPQSIQRQIEAFVRRIDPREK